MLDSDWLIAKHLESPWLDWINFISARLKSRSFLISFHFEYNWLRKSHNCYNLFYPLLRLFNSSFLKTWDLFLLFIHSSLIMMPSLSKNERVACLDCGRDYTRLHQDIVSTVGF